jgi:hypothetical protein
MKIKKNTSHSVFLKDVYEQFLKISIMDMNLLQKGKIQKKPKYCTLRAITLWIWVRKKFQY